MHTTIRTLFKRDMSKERNSTVSWCRQENRQKSSKKTKGQAYKKEAVPFNAGSLPRIYRRQIIT